jgi:hypothetical protein
MGVRVARDDSRKPPAAASGVCRPALLEVRQKQIV